MNRVIFVIISLAFVQLVSSQSQACTNAISALRRNTASTDAFAAGRGSDVTCTGTCRNLIDDIISNCDASVSQSTLAS